MLSLIYDGRGCFSDVSPLLLPFCAVPNINPRPIRCLPKHVWFVQHGTQPQSIILVHRVDFRGGGGVKIPKERHCYCILNAQVPKKIWDGVPIIFRSEGGGQHAICNPPPDPPPPRPPPVCTCILSIYYLW